MKLYEIATVFIGALLLAGLFTQVIRVAGGG